ncbi:helix-turn-helix domain-containing protein [Pantoea sp. GM01]|uniref:helix-turn-helix domain-containing protein n=1 Tax=Pantoea sp. GM01 TaxID=1144320 RepID=UPI000270F092|nr:helix-turn-helix domain-containing protein [Pantoea sp. GM01]EJL93163.1 DNA-binding domain-containing protein, AraC-type [Pantoea sp. GM01]
MTRDERIVYELPMWIEENINSPLKIQEVALRAGYSKWHIQRMFARVMSITLAEYIRNRKLNLAAESLIYSSNSIIEISLDYGFTSQQAFTRAFVKYYQVPPAVYRRVNKRFNN